MLKGITNICNGIIIYAGDNSDSKTEVSFIFKINPIQNYAMMSDEDMQSAMQNMGIFLGINTFTFKIIKKKVDITDYDYLDNYQSYVDKKDLKPDNDLHKEMLHGTAKMIQEYTKGTTKHEYFLKYNAYISDKSSAKEIIKKHKEIQNVIDAFPIQFGIEKMLNSKEVLIYLLKEARFVTTEINTLVSKDLDKSGFYHDIIKDN